MTALLEKSYWTSTGKYQALSKQFRSLVPNEGPAEPPLELFRCATNIYYDCYNNGGCNLYVMGDQLSTLLQFAHDDHRNRFHRIASILFSHRVELENDHEGWNGDDDDDYDDDGCSMYLEDGWMEPLEELMDAVILATKKAMA